MKKQLKQTLSLLMSLVMIISMFTGINIGSFAENPEYVPTDVKSEAYVLENIEYEEAEDGSGIIITGASEDISGDITLPSEIGGKKVIAVESFAFYGAENILSVTFPESIKSIGYSAFDGCTSLVAVSAEGCEVIDTSAFEDAQALEYISFSDDIRKVAYDVFDGTKYYNDASNWEDGALYVDSILVEYNGNATEYEIKNGTTVIASQTFYIRWTGNETLESLYIPSTVKTIGSGAFMDCYALTDVQIEYGLETIEESAFYDCSSLVSINIPESVTTLEGAVFYGCTALESITIPESVTTLSRSLFDGCSSLTDIDIHDNITSVESNVFSGTPYYNNEANWEDGALYFGNYLIAVKYNVRNLDVKDGTTCIAGNFIDFDGYEGYWPYSASIYDLDLPDSLISIGNYAFLDCPSLYSVEIPENVQNIGRNAFGYKSEKESDSPVYGFTIYGESGSVAEEYANENEITFVAVSRDEPTTEEPTTEEPTTEEPTTEEPTTEEPTTEEPTTQEPTTEEPTTEEPTTEEPTTEEPTTEEPTTEEPTTEEPTTEEPTTEEPTTEEPTTEEPTTEEPTTEKPDENNELEIKGDGEITTDKENKLSYIGTGETADTITAMIENDYFTVVDKNGDKLAGNSPVGTGSSIRVLDKDGNTLNEYTVIVPTDIDGNGKTTAADARLALRASAKIDTIDGVYAVAADANNDKKITAMDARTILRKAAGLE